MSITVEVGANCRGAKSEALWPAVGVVRVSLVNVVGLGVWVFKCSGVQVFRCSDVHVRCSGVH